MYRENIPAAMSVAGSDPCSGAGIQADLKTFTAHGVYGLTAVTAVTVQNTQQVYSVQEVTPQVVFDQMYRLFEDIRVGALKTGMLYSTDVVNAIERVLQEFYVPCLVIDPVMVSTSGHMLLKKDAREHMLGSLFPRATLVTPNIYEAEAVTGKSLSKWEDVQKAATEILGMGPKAVVIKGGDFRDRPGCDLYADGNVQRTLESGYVASSSPHGTGCMFSSAITANLALGMDLEKAVFSAKNYITRAIKSSLQIGKGKAVPGY